jgi:glucan phosphoethanolaminetransferase (alkaline phosphatase superfamily)
MAGNHLHLILNHIPVIGIYFGLLLLITGLLKKNGFIKYLALWLLLILAIIALPVYFSGEGAEETVDKMPFTSDEILEKHEWAGQLSLVGFLLIGLSVILIFLLRIFKGEISNSLVIAVLILTVITAGVLAWTADLGGKIRRPELRGETVSPSYEQYYDVEKDNESEEP